MPTPTRSIEPEMVCHVVNRGVDKRDIFLDDQDYARFLHNMFVCNDTDGRNPNWSRTLKRSDQMMDPAGSSFSRKGRGRLLIVDVLAFCLMPNHYHLLLRERSEGGVSAFMRRLSTAYAKYFNEKYERSGALFEGRYKLTPVEHEHHFLYLPYYIHLNPLDLHMPEWRTEGVSDPDAALVRLEEHRWSSHLDYMGIENLPSVTQREFLTAVFAQEGGYEVGLREWLGDFDTTPLEDIPLE